MREKTDGAVLEKVPKYHALLYPTLEALKALGKSGTIEEIVDKVIELKAFPPEVQQIPHGNHRRSELEYRLAWARTYLKRVGAVTNSTRGVWTLTEKGAALTEKDCAGIPKEVRKQDRKQGATKSITLEDEWVDEDEQDSWEDKLLSILLALKPQAFERLGQRLLREAGFTKVEVTGKSGDGGIDGIGILRVNLVSFTVLFQCKRYKASVSPSEVRDFRGAMQGRCDKGLILTTGTFTSDAKKEATRDGAPTIDLIDGNSLCDLLKQFRLGVEVEQIEKVSVNDKWFADV